MSISDSEYESLRNEINAWQSRRFTILTASITLVSTLLGLNVVQNNTAQLDWPLITALLWFFLGASTALTWYAGLSNAKIAAYLMVFSEDNKGWESRLLNLQEVEEIQSTPKKSFIRLEAFNLNRMIFLIYMGLGILSILIPSSIRGTQSISIWHIFLLVFTGAWFFFSLTLLIKKYPRNFFFEKWMKVKNMSEQ